MFCWCMHLDVNTYNQQWLGSDLHICIENDLVYDFGWKIEATAECLQPTLRCMSVVCVCVCYSFTVFAITLDDQA